MPSELVQSNFNSPATIVIALIVLVLAVGVMVLLFVRSTAQRRERETRVRKRLLEMEREAEFAAAANRVPISRRPAEVAASIAGLVGEYLSMPVLAVYAGRVSDETLSNVLSSPLNKKPVGSVSELPASVPASLLRERVRPTVAPLADIVGHGSGDTPAPDKLNAEGVRASVAPVADDLGEGSGDTQASDELEAEVSPRTSEESTKESSQFGEESPDTDPAEQNQSWAVSGSGESRPPRAAEYVVILPWRGPFQTNGLIVTLAPPGIDVEMIEGYGDPLARLTDKLAVALELKQNDAAVEALDQRASRTTHFSRALITCLEETSPLDAITREVTRLTGSDSAALWRVDEAGAMVRMVAAYGLKSAEFLPLPLGQGLAGSVAESGEVLGIEDAPADPRCIFPREARESGIVSYLGAPLATDGNTLGVIEVHSASRRSWSEADRSALESGAAMIAELLRSTDSRVNRLRVESAYLGLSESLQELRSPEEIKEAVVEVLGHALGASRVLVVEFDERGQAEQVKHEYRQPSAKSAIGASFGAALAARVAASLGPQPIAISDSKEHSLVGSETAAEFGVLSEMAVPIRVDGKTRAIIYVNQCDRVREWDEEEIEFAERVVRQLSLSLSNLRALELAFSDAHQARAEARRASKGSASAEAMLAELPEMIIGLDGEGRVTFFNAAARDQIGLTSDDLGRMANVTEALAAIEGLDRIVACQSVIRIDGRIKVRAGDASEPAPVSISVAPVRDEKGEIARRLIVATDLSHSGAAGGASTRIQELEGKLEGIDRALAGSRAAEEQARALLAKASAQEAKARAEADVSRRFETEVRQQLERIQEEHKQVQGSAQQLLEINRLKSEFIVNAGHEIEASLQSVLGLAELLERGSYGDLSPEQKEAVHDMYGWARRIKSDVDWLIEYGSARSRRLEPSGDS
jgi:GAF domain-containing protein